MYQLLRGLCHPFRADRDLFLARCPKGIRRIQTFTFTCRDRARDVRSVAYVVAFFHGPIRCSLFLPFGAGVFGTNGCFHRFNRALDQVFFPAFLCYLFVVFNEDRGRRTTYLPRFLCRACTIFRRPSRDGGLLREDLRAIFFRCERGRFNGLFVQFLLSVLIIRPGAFLVVGFDAQLATAIRIRWLCGFIR